MRRLGVRLGNWLTPEQGRRLIEHSTPSTPRELRDHAMVAMLIGCGLRRAELLALTLESVQQREEHWVKATVDAWTDAANITHGTVFRAINKAGRVWGDGMSPKVLWDVVRAAAARAGIDKLAPHDLRRTCARLCHLGGRRTGSDPILAGARLDPDDGTLSWMQAAIAMRRQRPPWNRARRRLIASDEGRTTGNVRPWRLHVNWTDGM